MNKPIILIPNKEKNGFAVPSVYNKRILEEWIKKYKSFEVKPRENESTNTRRFLEGAVIPAYCEWQYGINARDMRRDEARRTLFKKDFHYEVVKDRLGNPVKSPLSSKGVAKMLIEKFTRYAEENGCPIPNADLYKLWRDEWSMDLRFPNYFEFLDFLKLDVDAMPSDTILNQLGKKEKIEYPKNNLGKTKF